MSPALLSDLRSSIEPRRASRPRMMCAAGTLSVSGVSSGDLAIRLGAFASGRGDHRIVTMLGPGGRERMRRLIDLVAFGRVDFVPLVTHRFPLARIKETRDLFLRQRDGALKVANMS